MALKAIRVPSANRLESQRERTARAAQVLADKTAKFNQAQSNKEALFQAQETKKAAQAAAAIAKITSAQQLTQAKQAEAQAKSAARIAQIAATTNSYNSSATTALAPASTGLVSVPSSVASSTAQIDPNSPVVPGNSAYNPAAADAAQDQSYDDSGYSAPAPVATIPAALPAPASNIVPGNSAYNPNAADAAQDQSYYDGSGYSAPVASPTPGPYVVPGNPAYNPNAADAMAYVDDPNSAFNSPDSGATLPASSGDPDINQLTSDPVMQAKLLAVKRSNPEYYQFIANYLKSNPSILRSYNLAGMGDDAASTDSSSSSSLASIFSSILTPISQAYQAKVTGSPVLTPAQQQAKLAAMKQSNATLTGDTETKMYLFGALALAMAAFFLVRQNRR